MRDYVNQRFSFLPSDWDMLKELQSILQAKHSVGKVTLMGVIRYAIKETLQRIKSNEKSAA